ncbi:hypothetical protein [Clostridium sp.]|uniref:hypothetical protein n=1 Tax=Clostridium sp. TaxID=1506 RepID=UPI0025C47BBB|nr:hypothetical protein [Clostridium sp.]
MEFKIGDKVVFKNSYNGVEGEVVGVELNERCKNRYLVKSDSIGVLSGWSYAEAKRNFDDEYDIKPYEGYAIWTDDIEKIEEVKEENCVGIKFNLGQNVVCEGEECKIVGIDKSNIIKDLNHNCYLITTNKEKYVGSFCTHRETFKDDDDITFLDGIPDDTKCRWVGQEDIEEIQKDYEFKDETVLNQCNYREECMIAEADANEERIKNEFDKIREQKKETVKEMSEKVLGLTLEIKEIEAEIEKIKKEWHL